MLINVKKRRYKNIFWIYQTNIEDNCSNFDL